MGDSDILKVIAKLECDLDAVMQLGIDKWLTEDQIRDNPEPAQRATMAREYALRALEAKDARILELEEQVASLQRVLAHRRDTDSQVDA